MKNLIKPLLAITLLSAVSSASAVGWTGKNTISAIYPLNTGATVYMFDTASSAECQLGSEGNGKYMILQPSHQNYDTLTAMLLGAQMSEKPVNISIGGCDSNNFSIIDSAILGDLR